ncbi:MAG TPA: UDP-N-acetylmuramoyl-L-alanyl-D-glutamate--2,6-diaminopimelate ligase [Bacteriovoracaceae bacterium]|nr:UDP-N-acetylmuramoyl-L-alanyl-D-glutamate--2,6-diaminopimelate ligase [Bacteriovoracaceae bacterium]
MLNNILNEISGYNDIHWKCQDSTVESVLFYKIPEGSNELDLFYSRIKEAKYKFLITNKETKLKEDNVFVVSNEHWPELQKVLLDQVYPLPPLKFLAVTGTNGKTTTASLVLQLGESLGLKGISIGTLGVRDLENTLHDFGLTSPPYIDLRKFLSIYGKDKDFCVMEASSHALMQDRLYNIKFDVAGWLSFSQDHLDYHKTMGEYFLAKARIYQYLNGPLFIPEDQHDLSQILSSYKYNVEKAPFYQGETPLFLNAQFNQSNLSVAISMVEYVWKKKIDPAAILNLKSADGRFYIQEIGESYVVVDFAHTPDALKNICQGIKKAFPDYNLKLLFGCGGDRDRSKREVMGRIAHEMADYIYLTSDNPRSEDPELIIKDIAAGISTKNLEMITERPSAVRKALAELKAKEVLLLAGKGHENYILKMGVKHPYSDIEEVESFIKGRP